MLLWLRLTSPFDVVMSAIEPWKHSLTFSIFRTRSSLCESAASRINFFSSSNPSFTLFSAVSCLWMHSVDQRWWNIRCGLLHNSQRCLDSEGNLSIQLLLLLCLKMCLKVLTLLEGVNLMPELGLCSQVLWKLQRHFESDFVGKHHFESDFVELERWFC